MQKTKIERALIALSCKFEDTKKQTKKKTKLLYLQIKKKLTMTLNFSKNNFK